MEEVKAFLLKNGFREIESGFMANDMCAVEINGDNDGYTVSNNDGGTMYSADKNIYWLIGVLTYYNYINRNYE